MEGALTVAWSLAVFLPVAELVECDVGVAELAGTEVLEVLHPVRASAVASTSPLRGTNPTFRFMSVLLGLVVELDDGAERVGGELGHIDLLVGGRECPDDVTQTGFTRPPLLTRSGESTNRD